MIRGCGGNHNITWMALEVVRFRLDALFLRTPSCTGLQLQLQLRPDHLQETGLQTFCKTRPASPGLKWFWWVSEFTPIQLHVSNSWTANRKEDASPSSLRTAVKLIRRAVRLYARYFWDTGCLLKKKKKRDLRREGVWGRLLCVKRNTKYRPNICLSLSVKAACPLIDGTDLRH